MKLLVHVIWRRSIGLFSEFHSTFSWMKNNNSRSRSARSDKHLSDVLCLATSGVTPDFSALSSPLSTFSICVGCNAYPTLSNVDALFKFIALVTDTDRFKNIDVVICKPNCTICNSVVHMVNKMILFTLIWSDF